MAGKTKKSEKKVSVDKSLNYHLKQVIGGKRRFENVFRSVSRMILEGEDKIEKVTVNGRSTYDFSVFRQGKKHIIGMFDEINSFVSQQLYHQHPVFALTLYFHLYFRKYSLPKPSDLQMSGTQFAEFFHTHQASANF